MSKKLLTREEWIDAKPPLHYMKVDGDNWTAVHRDMIVKWLEAHCGKSWIYFDGGNIYVFGSEGDKIIFKMWIKSDPFENMDGDLT
jgi:hypothetical protein